MMMPAFRRLGDDAEWWSDPSYVVSETRPPIALTATTDGNPPDDAYVKMMLDTLSEVDVLVLAAGALILDNYSYEHFQKLGVDESLLVKEESPSAIARAVTLVSAWFHDADGDSFELSFAAPWDDHHSFDVEFDGGEATCCSVNG